ncbi:two-component system CheB/CheR fusion protein [Pedobacter sp. UYEF25]
MQPASDHTNLSVSKLQFPVVGIGASAGGLEAFKRLVGTIPERSGMAYVFVQHLSPTYVSNLTEILQKSSRVPIQQIRDNVHLEPDMIYIIPPGMMLTAMDGMLKLKPITDKKIKIIDLFFSSLGIVHQSFAVGVVLSGSLNDGTLGLQVIKSSGGLTFAQDDDAAFDSMPNNAIKSGAVDFILPADQIIPKLVAINHPFPADYTKQEIRKGPHEDEQVLRELLNVIRLKSSVDFTNYKQSTIKRRIMRRMALNRIEKAKEYLEFLRGNKNEQDALYNDLLISVTSFFRDTKSFELLCSIIFPRLLDQKPGDEPLRIWVAGCATGEEAYSMAICIHEYLGDKGEVRKIQIFASDVSAVAIAQARSGIYQSADLEGISPVQLKHYFTRLDGSYRINRDIREMCVFAHHNLLKDPPFSKIDLLSCRNVLIYFGPILQKRVLSIFHYALNETGYLMLGKSETIGSSTDLFTPTHPREKIYRSKGGHGKYINVSSAKSERSLRDIDQDSQSKGSANDLHKLADEVLLSRYMPASVIVNQSFDVVEFRGKTEPWLALQTGRASLNILKMAREGLSFEIQLLLNLARAKQVSVSKNNLSFNSHGRQYVNIDVMPLADDPEDFYLIVFHAVTNVGRKTLNSSGGSKKANAATALRNEQLENEITQTRENMRVVTEIQEAANEELQSANEELLSGNEELQSMNEELETSREELQSSNEEITTVNRELIERNDQLNNSRRYTEEVFNTIYDPLIILDKELRVLRATEGFYNMFKVDEQGTEGCFLSDLGNGQWNIPILRRQLERVLPKLGSFKAFEVDHVFNVIGRRVMGLTATEFESHMHEKLILLAIHDITDKRKVEDGLVEVERLLAESKERRYFALDSAGVGIWDHNLITGEMVWDNRCRKLHRIDQRKAIDYAVFLGLVDARDRHKIQETILQAIRWKKGETFDLEYRIEGSDDHNVRWLKSKGKVYFNKKKEATRFIGTVLDFSVEKAFQEQIKELLIRKDEFMNIASHELKTPITSLRAIVQILAKFLSKKEDLKVHDLAQRAIKQIDKLSSLVTDLLDVTKIQSGQLELEKSSFSIIELIEECAEQLGERPEGYKIAVMGPREILVYADRNRIEQVLINLMTNAIKYAPTSNLMKIGVTHHDGDVEVTVTDFGIGISHSEIPFVFDRFFRVEESSRSLKGLGPGLYISAEIVKRHKGEIGIKSEPGEGSTFWFTIPV